MKHPPSTTSMILEKIEKQVSTAVIIFQQSALDIKSSGSLMIIGYKGNIFNHVLNLDKHPIY